MAPLAPPLRARIIVESPFAADLGVRRTHNERAEVVKFVKRRVHARANEAVNLALRLAYGRRWQSTERFGMAWYTAKQWALLRELADDPQALDDSYQEWRTSADETVALLRSEGVSVEKVPLDVERVAEWCKRNDRPFNSASRAAYVAEFLQGQSSGRGRRRIGR